jgi:endonuclease G
MRKKLLLIIALITFLSLFVTLALHAQDTITLVHKSYKTTFSKSKHYPVKVEWWLTKTMLNCTVKIKRSDKFIADPLLPNETKLQPDYDGSGFDRGHNFNAADGACNETSMNESFYFSNMTAQYPSLNRGDWKVLEALTRTIALEKDSVYIWCGSIGVAKKIGTTSVPTECWKVVYIKKTKEWMAYAFKNTTAHPSGLESHKVNVADITKLTGFTFKAK